MELIFVGLELLQRRVVLSEHLHHHFNTVSEWEGKEKSVLEHILQLRFVPPVSGSSHFEESRAPEAETEKYS